MAPMGRMRRTRHELTARQREVLQLVARGHTNGEIAEILGISADGVKWHVSELLTRLDMDSREELAQFWASENGMRARFGRFAAALGGLVPLKATVGALGGFALLSGAALIITGGFPGLSGGTSDAAASSPDSNAATSTVTFADYTKAFTAYSACLEPTGWKFVSPPRLTARNEYDFQLYRPGSDPAASADQRNAWSDSPEQCRSTYFDDVQYSWAMQSAMSGDERQAARDSLGACLRAGGYSVPAHPTSADWDGFANVKPGVTDPAVTRAFLGCARATADKYGLRTGEVP